MVFHFKSCSFLSEIGVIHTRRRTALVVANWSWIADFRFPRISIQSSKLFGSTSVHVFRISVASFYPIQDWKFPRILISMVDYLVIFFSYSFLKFFQIFKLWIFFLFADFESDFKEQLKSLMSLLLSPENLAFKQIGGNRIHAGELLQYFKSLLATFNGDTLPNPKSMLEVSIFLYPKLI